MSTTNCNSCILAQWAGVSDTCWTCESRLRDNLDQSRIYTGFWPGPGSNPFVEPLPTDDIIREIPLNHFQYDRYYAYKQEGLKLYELTLTEPSTDSHDPATILASFTKFLESRMLNVIDYLAVIELHKNGHPHIHALLACDIKKLEKSKILATYPHRAELALVRDLNKYLIYIHKDILRPNIVSFKHTHGVPTILQKQKTPDQAQTNLSPQGNDS